MNREEIKLVRLRGAILSSFNALLLTVTPLATLVSIMVMIFTGKHATASDVFTLFMALSVVKIAVCKYLADSTRYLADVSVSLRRIQKFLEHDTSYEFEEKQLLYSGPFDQLSAAVRKTEVKPPLVRKISRNSDRHNSSKRYESMFDDTIPGTPVLLRRRRLSTNVLLKNAMPHVTIERVSCKWNETSEQKTLGDISLHVPNRRLVIVTGQSGSGKSSLLLSIMEEIPLSSGKLSSAGRIAYVSQTPWVFSGTLRDNILFGRVYEESKYQQALRSCDLHKDVFSMRKGDMTQVGQHGAGLSGGQRARVALARAVYSDANIYLLDDPLSALDAKVAKHVFGNCICEALAGRLRILATHQVQFVHSADYIVMLQHGSIAFKGNYRDLEKSGLLAAELELAQGKVETTASAEEEIFVPTRRFTSMSEELDPSQEDAQCLNEEDEERASGSVSWKLYWCYFRASLHSVLIALLALFFVAVQGKWCCKGLDVMWPYFGLKS